jgi:hypothetical protein
MMMAIHYFMTKSGHMNYMTQKALLDDQQRINMIQDINNNQAKHIVQPQPRFIPSPNQPGFIPSPNQPVVPSKIHQPVNPNPQPGQIPQFNPTAPVKFDDKPYNLVET